MKEEQKKIELLQKIAHRLNEAHVQWALGASMLLYFKSITSEFHDRQRIPLHLLEIKLTLRNSCHKIIFQPCCL